MKNKKENWFKEYEYIAAWISVIPIFITGVIAIYFYFNNPFINFPSPDRCIPSASLKDKAIDMCNQIDINETLAIPIEEFYKQENINIFNAEIKKISDSVCEIKCRVAYNVNIVESIGIQTKSNIN